ncbi:DHA2 family efflux MFS transporter permease subunit [Croceicoccus sp. F390]|uniref:DHA2 family efflux MFS transporter permease subunit n=1 Tax=Croceicoccus esteveae TaxID=3075597 RepID=A0ABU2ZDW3_9SPHN|nr:DHA2 family efflux MFS transporter permease subunit [Croceicoccus sp. F390]MDT0574792.1 DHA2 family efflux MFS transporter permease subunit [Croceicoccus sp. F390]
MASGSPAKEPGVGKAGSGGVGGADIAHVVVPNRGIVFFAVMLAAMLQVLDTTIANVALPHMQASLGATSDSITWVLTSYIVASAIALPITGFLAARFGTRRLFIVSVAAFVLFSMLCGLSTSLPAMVMFRIGQGIAGAFIIPLSQSIMLDISKPSKHALSMSIWGLGVMIGPILGPIIGGWLTESYNWRWVFFVNVPLGALALFLLVTQLPHWPARRPRFDITGFLLVGLAIASLQLLLDRGQHVDWFDSPEVWIYTVVVLCAGWAGVIHLATAHNPMFDRELFADRNLVVAMIIMIIVGVGIFATLALLPPLLQNLMGYSVLQTGFVLAPRGVGVLLSMQLAGLLVRKGLDARILVGTGFIVTAASMFEMAHWSLGVDSFHIVSSGVVQGVGLGLIFIPLNTVAFATLRPQLRTDGSSILNLSRSIGASLGISIVTTLLARNIQISHSEVGANLTAATLPIFNIGALDRYGQVGEAALRMIDAEVNRQAAMIAYINDFWLMGWICLLATPLVLLIRPPRGNARDLPPPDLGH